MGTDRTQMVFERGVKVVANSDMVIQDADKMMNLPLLSGRSSWVIVHCPFAVVLLCAHPVCYDSYWTDYRLLTSHVCVTA
jgi:hypothetical protein